MALVANGFIPEARIANALAGSQGGFSGTSDVDLQFDIASALLTAVDGGLFSCTVSVTSFAAADLQNEMGILQALGYTVSLSSTTLTIKW